MIKRDILNIEIQDFEQKGMTEEGNVYEAKIVMDKEEIGILKDDRNGKGTEIAILKNKDEFDARIKRYFNEIGLDTVGVEECNLYFTFAEHLFDLFEWGSVTEETLRRGMIDCNSQK